MKKGNIQGKIFRIALIVVFAITALYLLIDVGNAGKILTWYSNISTKDSSGISKRLQFLQEYTKQTSDFSLAKQMGYTDEDIEAWYSTENTSTTTSTGGGVTPTAWDASNWSNAVSEHASKWGIDSNKENWSAKTVGGTIYLSISQKSAVYGYLKSSGGSTVSGSGCMLAAVASLHTNLSGTIYGIEDLLQDLGYTVEVNSGGQFETTNATLPCVGRNPDNRYADGTTCLPESILMKLGYTVSETNSIDRNLDFAKQMYFVHVKNDNDNHLSSGGEHWFLIVGVDGTNYQIVYGAGDAKSGSYNASYTDSKLDHIYLVDIPSK